jgi:alanine-alpha-ketoisovalerate/valine-pyruvate aminotransferase
MVAKSRYTPKEGDTISFYYMENTYEGVITDACSNHVVVFPHTYEYKDKLGTTLEWDHIVAHNEVIGLYKGETKWKVSSN